MKFNVAWAKVAQENAILKFALLLVTSLCGVLAIGMSKVALKEPLVIERACFSKALAILDSKRTTSEVVSFVEEAVVERFDSQVVGQGYLSSAEAELKRKEQKDLEARKLNQKVVVRHVSVSEAGITVEADRLISVGEIRSAFKFPLAVRVESVPRSAANPYGLILSDVKSIEKKEGK